MLKSIWKFWSSLKPAAFIFSALTISILIGSFIIQKPNAQEGQIEKAYSPETLQIFEFFGFLDLFHSPWFVFLIFLLAVNVICASIEMWPRHWRLFKTRDADLSESALRNQRFVAEVSDVDSSKLENSITKFFGKPEWDAATKRFYLNKQRYAYFGVYVVHAALIIIFIGGVRGAIDGYEGQLSLMEGESSAKVYIRNAIKRNKVLDFEIKCHDIRIETYEDGSPKDYFSDLEVIDNGKSIERRVIEVNDPISYKGINFYQANYGKQKVGEQNLHFLNWKNKKTGASQKIEWGENDGEYKLPGDAGALRFVSYNPNPVMPTDKGPMELGETLRFELVKNGKSEAVTLFAKFPEVDSQLRANATDVFEYRGRIEDYELREVTGLQVSYDPGAPIVFLGCAILMVGIFWTFFTSHQKLWVLKTSAGWILAGKTYRSEASFSRQFEALVDEIKKHPV